MTLAPNVSPPVTMGLYPTPTRGLTLEELELVTTRAESIIRGYVDRLSRTDWEQGLIWYQTANQYVRHLADMFNLDWRDLAWSLALLSPQNRWDQNKVDLVELIETGNCGALPLGTGRAIQVLAGESDGPSIAGGRKVRSFGWNIEHPHTSLDVTLDTHMANVLQLPNTKYLERRGVYDALADAFRKVAEDHGILPHQLQAALWINTRGAWE